MPSRFDHAVVIVPSLTRAVRSLERLGFHVVMGGRTGPVHNALILFTDGTYIELTTNRFSAARPLYRALNTAGLIGRVASKRGDMLHRFLPWIGAPAGAIDWCIRVDDIRATIQQLCDAGVEMVDEMEFERERPDGKVAKWLLAGPRDVRFPFFIEDLTPVEIRIPFREHSVHPNGVTGIARLVSPPAAKEAFEQTMGSELRGEPGALGSVTIASADDAGRFQGRYALELLRPEGADEELAPNQTCGVSLKLVHRV